MLVALPMMLQIFQMQVEQLLVFFHHLQHKK
jgi:hypothetical protein